MLIWIDASVLTADLAVDNEACLGLSAIFDAVFRGEHYALGTRETLSALAANANLSPLTKRTINTILAKLPTIGSITELVLTRVDVTYGQATAIVRISQKKWEVPLAVIGVCCVTKAVLLGENLDDTRAFEHAAKQYQAAKGISGQVKLEHVLGGGSTTPNVFSNIVRREKKWCLCLTDSDRLYPKDGMCDTAKKCSAIAEENSIIASHIDLEAREIENVLPLAFLAEVIPPTHQSLWDWHVSSLCGLRSEAHKFCDIKFGTRLRNFCSQSEDNPKRRFWNSVVNDLTSASALHIECDQPFNTVCNNTKNCDCFVTSGFGEMLLGSILKQLDMRSSHASERQTRNDPNRNEWMTIGQVVFEWGCAPAPTRS